MSTRSGNSRIVASRLLSALYASSTTAMRLLLIIGSLGHFALQTKSHGSHLACLLAEPVLARNKRVPLSRKYSIAIDRSEICPLRPGRRYRATPHAHLGCHAPPSPGNTS